MIAVAVSQRVDVIRDRTERRDALDQRLTTWLAAFGFAPVPVPNNLGPRLPDWLAAVGISRVLLSGGNDIREAPERDDTETRLLEWARERRVPLLGICRGMQMMGVCGNAGLRRVSGHARTRHRIHGRLAGDANSFHDWALDSCPQGFSVLSTAEDGVLEAIRHVELPWEGWMWHPEREATPSSRDSIRLRSLFGA